MWGGQGQEETAVQPDEVEGMYGFYIWYLSSLDWLEKHNLETESVDVNMQYICSPLPENSMQCLNLLNFVCLNPLAHVSAHAISSTGYLNIGFPFHSKAQMTGTLWQLTPPAWSQDRR